MEDNIQEMYARGRKAFEEVEFWSQEKVDMVCQAVGYALTQEDVRITLGNLAVDESGIGKKEDKIAKIYNKTLGTLWDQKGVKTCGMISDDKEMGVRTFAKPMGVVANVVPCTNPESTICCLALSTIKTRNAMIVTPHPRTQETSYKTVEFIREALEKVGAPVDLVQCIKKTSHAATSALMAECDFAVATGGAALAKVVFEAGKPSQTVGAGNVVAIVDESANLADAAEKIRISKIANNAASCSSENAVAIYETKYDQMLEELKKQKAYLLSTDERETLRKYMWPDGVHLNRDVVAKPATVIAEAAGISVPGDTDILMVIGEKVGPEDRFSGEKISPILTVWKWNDFDEMVDRLGRILKFSGEGHSVSIHTENDDQRVKLALNANVGRVVAGFPHAHANSGGWDCGLACTDTLGGGSWAGNSTSDNINWSHFLNYTLLSVPKERYMPTEEELFGEYFEQFGRE